MGDGGRQWWHRGGDAQREWNSRRSRGGWRRGVMACGFPWVAAAAAACPVLASI